MYVQTVLDVHKKYNALVMSAFNNDAGFVAALDKVSVSLYCLFSVYEQSTFSLTLFCITGLWSLHKQQCSYQNGPVIQ